MASEQTQCELWSNDPGRPAAPAARPMVVTEPGQTVESLAMCVLGSGSGGNCSVVRVGRQAMLIDAGFGPLTTARRLVQAHLSLDQVRAVCLTHLDQDHFRPHWIRTLVESRIELYVHRGAADDLMRLDHAHLLAQAGLVRLFDQQAFSPMAGMAVQPIQLAHDRKGTTGFRIDTPGGGIGYATDLGVVPPDLIDLFVGVDVLAMESNYDPQMQLGSRRPDFLKRRIMGGAGHLSNQQAFEAVCQVMDRSLPRQPQHVVLLHRSRQCNCPARVRTLFEQHPAIGDRLVLAEQRRRSPWLTVGRKGGCLTGRQLNLFG